MLFTLKKLCQNVILENKIDYTQDTPQDIKDYCNINDSNFYKTIRELNSLFELTYPSQIKNNYKIKKCGPCYTRNVHKCVHHVTQLHTNYSLQNDIHRYEYILNNRWIKENLKLITTNKPKIDIGFDSNFDYQLIDLLNYRLKSIKLVIGEQIGVNIPGELIPYLINRFNFKKGEIPLFFCDNPEMKHIIMDTVYHEQKLILEFYEEPEKIPILYYDFHYRKIDDSYQFEFYDVSNSPKNEIQEILIKTNENNIQLTLDGIKQEITLDITENIIQRFGEFIIIKFPSGLKLKFKKINVPIYYISKNIYTFISGMAGINYSVINPYLKSPS